MYDIIFINCSRFPFVDWIRSRRKLYETRTRNTLRAVVGQRVYLAETGRGRSVVRCSAVIGDPVVASSRSAWRKFMRAACIVPGSVYDWKPETKKKYLYPVMDVQPVPPFHPAEGVRHGRVWMEYNGKEVL